MSREQDTEEYGADSVSALEGLEAVRKRPGMYIGNTSKGGFHHLLWEIVDNSVDEAMGGYATAIDIILNEDGSATVSDDGRGIPVAPQRSGLYKGMPTVEMVLTVLHAGGKFGGGAYQFSGGLHGVGSSVVNALSEWMNVEVRREGQRHNIEFGYIEKGPHGKPVAGGVTKPLKSSGRLNKSDTGTSITFMPDRKVFPSVSGWDYDLVARRLRQGSFLNAGLTFNLTDARDPENVTTIQYHYPNGLEDFIAEQAEDRLVEFEHEDHELLPIQPILLGGEDAEIQGKWEMAFRWYPDTVYRVSSFANGIETGHGGAHVKGYENGLTRILNKYARQDHVGLLDEREANLEAVDVRSGLGVIIAVKVREPQFVGQTKDELSNDETRRMVAEGFNNQFWDWMENHPTETNAFVSKIVDAMRHRRKIEAFAAKEAEGARSKGEAAGSRALPAKLKDCQTRDRSEAELFIVEGDSAAGPAIKARNALNQAIISIRGKGLNIETALEQGERGLDRIASNKEVQELIATIGAGSFDLFDPDKMRYGKIIMLTDADDDGRHIQLLLTTLFYRLMPGLIESGKLYVARPPLYTTQTKNGKVYLANEEEREAFLEKYPRHSETFLRFKGLGEMNYDQLGETVIHPATRGLARYVIEDQSVANLTLNSLMGGNAAPKWEILSAVQIDDAEAAA